MGETYYLIDFENVGLKGLEGAQKLTKSDWVHLFSTCNAAKITTATLANFNATNLLVHEVPAKSQSVDMHLVSYLGYLLGSRDSAPQIVIVSNDTDYNDIVSFWNTEKGAAILRRDKLAAEEPKPVPVKTASDRKTASKKVAAQAEAKPDAPDQGSTKAKKTAKPTTTEPQADQKPDTVEKGGAKAKKTAKPTTTEPQADQKPDTAEKGGAKAKKAAKPKAVEPQDKTALNNAVLKTLSNAKYDNETVSFAASLVTKNFTEKGGKQIIYRTIISRFGQEQGLAIYRHIQKLL